jgi:hypothetical protein
MSKVPEADSKYVRSQVETGLFNDRYELSSLDIISHKDSIYQENTIKIRNSQS